MKTQKSHRLVHIIIQDNPFKVVSQTEESFMSIYNARAKMSNLLDDIRHHGGARAGQGHFVRIIKTDGEVEEGEEVLQSFGLDKESQVYSVSRARNGMADHYIKKFEKELDGLEEGKGEAFANDLREAMLTKQSRKKKKKVA